MDAKLNQRNQSFLKTSSPQEIKQQREEDQIQLRKQKRLDQTSKKRAYISESSNLSNLFTFPLEILSEDLKSLQPSLANPSTSPMFKLKSLLNLIATASSLQALTVSLQCLQKLFGKNPSMPYDDFFDATLVDVFMSLLSCEEAHIKGLVLWCLINVFNNGHHTISIFAQKGIFPRLAGILTSEPAEIVLEHCIWCIGNLISEGPEYRNLALQEHICEYILHYAGSQTRSVFKQSIWVLSNFCKGLPKLASNTISEVLAVVKAAVRYDDIEIIADSLWILDYLSKEDPHYAHLIVQEEFAPVLIEYMRHFSSKIQSPALKVLGNIIYHSDTDLRLLVELGFLTKLFALVSSANRFARREALFLFSNICGCEEDIILDVVREPEFGKIIEAMESPEVDMKIHAVFCVCNALAKRHTIITKKLLDRGVLVRLIHVLRSRESNILRAALKGLRFLFGLVSDVMSIEQWNEFLKEFSGMEGIGRLEELLHHENTEVSGEAKAIIEEFIGVDEHELMQPVEEFTFS